MLQCFDSSSEPFRCPPPRDQSGTPSGRSGFLEYDLDIDRCTGREDTVSVAGSSSGTVTGTAMDSGEDTEENTWTALEEEVLSELT